MAAKGTNILVVDVGGNNVKILDQRRDEPIKISSGPKMTARQMVQKVRKTTAGWNYSAVTIGYPGPVLEGRPAKEPRNLGPGWVEFDFENAFGVPVRMINDAAMQALGSYEGGRMLFLGLGTGLGSALIVQGVLAPLELAHLPYKGAGTFEDYVGMRGFERLGKKRWRHHVFVVSQYLLNALVADYVVLGGGNSRHLKDLPPQMRLGKNENAFRGGLRLWQGRDEVPRSEKA